MYNLSPQAGGRWTLPRSTETKELELFQRCVQSTERIADLVEFDLFNLLRASYLKFPSDPLWRHALGCVAEFLAEEETNKMGGIAPDGYEGLVSFYNLYAEACAKAADSIYEFLDGDGEAAGMHTAFRVLQAHNEARDVYLESIDFPAWL